MWNRRTVVKAGSVLPAAALVGAAAAPFQRATAGTDILALERFIYDPRFAEAFDVAQHAKGYGVALSPAADDLMDLWYGELDLLWREQPMPLAGVTMAEALFVLETLAMDHRMRVVYRGHHSVVEAGRISHELAGPDELVAPFAEWTGGAPWEPELARAMTACPLGEPAPGEARFETAVPGLSVRDVPLVSWIIAPRSAVALTLPN